MRRYVGLRRLHVVPTLVAIVVITFALISFVPGDPAQTLVGAEADEVRSWGPLSPSPRPADPTASSTR